MTHTSIVTSGTVLEVFDQGICIIADSGVGKTDLVLEMLDRGHSFITDDAVLLKKNGQKLIARAPETIKDRIAIRGLGIVSLRNSMNSQQIKRETQIKLVIELQTWDKNQWHALDPSRCLSCKQKFLGMTFDKFILPYHATRPVALLVELLVKQFIQMREPTQNIILWK